MSYLGSIVAKLLAKSPCDIIVYAGKIDRSGYEQISRVCKKPTTNNQALLVLSTVGGDPNAGFRIARALTHHYGGFRILIPGLCKSAGTLLCQGASEVIMADQGELGPLDVQVRKSDELFDMGSGLDTVQALNYMQTQAMNAFRTYMLEFKIDGGLSTKLAAEIASKFACGLFSPIYNQIDPVRLAELQRTIEIAYAYGARLSGSSKNLKPNGLNRLVSEYPSHGFVIDRKEAREIFEHIRVPDQEELELADFLYHHELNVPSGTPQVFRLNEYVESGNANNEQEPTAMATEVTG